MEAEEGSERHAAGPSNSAGPGPGPIRSGGGHRQTQEPADCCLASVTSRTGHESSSLIGYRPLDLLSLATLMESLSELGFEFVNLLHPLLELCICRVLTDTAQSPAQDFRTAGRDASGDQRVHGRQIRRPKPGHHGGKVPGHLFKRGSLALQSGPQSRAMRPGRLTTRNELDPCDGRRQSLMKLPECHVVGFVEPVHDLKVGFLALRPATTVDEDTERCLSRLDSWIVTVLQHLDPLNRSFGESRPQLPLDVAYRGSLHDILRELAMLYSILM